MIAASRKTLAILAALLTLTCAAQAADEKFDLSGVWNLEVDVAGQGGTPEFVFKQEGDKLTGKYTGTFGEADVTGKVDGNAVQFTIEAGEGMKIVYKGTYEVGEMKGDVNLADQTTGTWKGKRLDVSGVWVLEVKTEDQSGEPEFTFKQEGSKITGRYKGLFGESDVTGKLDGKNIEFSVEPGEGMKVVYKGTVEKDELKGDVDFAQQATGKFTGKRKPAEVPKPGAEKPAESKPAEAKPAETKGPGDAKAPAAK